MTGTDSAKVRPALLGLFLGLLLVGAAAGVAVASYGLVPRGLMEILRPALTVLMFLPVGASVLTIYLRRRRETKREADPQ